MFQMSSSFLDRGDILKLCDFGRSRFLSPKNSNPGFRFSN
jgi:hypothetical protein